MKNDFFEKGVAKIKIPWKEWDLITRVKSLTKTVSESRLKISNKQKTKEELALNSFKTSFLNNEEKNWLVGG